MKKDQKFLNNTEERLLKMDERIKDPNFRSKKGMANEVNYWIFDYPPKDELMVRDYLKHLIEKNKRGFDDYSIFVVDVYDFIIKYLEEKGFLERCYQFEEKQGFSQINRAIGNLLRIDDSNSVLNEYIKSNAPENSIIFLTGIGKAYPILRSHKILNTLHQVYNNSPVVLFFPGFYDKQTLQLFGEFKDDNYYRAFKLVE